MKTCQRYGLGLAVFLSDALMERLLLSHHGQVVERLQIYFVPMEIECFDYVGGL